MQTYLDFEKPIAELERRLTELRETASDGIDRHRQRDRQARGQVGQVAQGHLCAADPVAEDARSRATPTGRISRIIVAGMADDFVPLAGDRAFADDPAIIGGLARIGGKRGDADRP